MNLESVDFVHPIYLPSQRNQTEMRSLNHMKDSERHPTEPDTDRPSWVIVLKANWIEISVADHVRERLGSNAEKDQVKCVPLTNVRSFVALPEKAKPLAKAKAPPATA
jgi:hypothetical protein